MNEMYRLYNQLGFQDFDGMIESVCLDKRIGFSHTQVPGPDGQVRVWWSLLFSKRRVRTFEFVRRYRTASFTFSTVN